MPVRAPVSATNQESLRNLSQNYWKLRCSGDCVCGLAVTDHAEHAVAPLETDATCQTRVRHNVLDTCQTQRVRHISLVGNQSVVGP